MFGVGWGVVHRHIYIARKGASKAKHGHGRRDSEQVCTFILSGLGS